MITRLLEEANADADHEGYCDTEIGKSTLTRQKLAEDIERLTSKVEEGKASLIEMAEDASALQKDLEELTVVEGEVSEQRQAEAKANKAAIKDAKMAKEAVKAAATVLKSYYAKSLQSTSFVGTADEPYSDREAQAGTVLALMEVVESDFERAAVEAHAEEETSKEEYEKFLTQTKKSKAVKGKKLDMIESDRATADTELRHSISDLKSAQDELVAAKGYYEKLEAECVDKGVSFKERTAARDAEVQSLKEALAMLGGVEG